MTEIEFASPLVQMSCFETTSDDPAELAEFNRFYTDVHSPEVIRLNHGIVRGYRYALARADINGAFGPKWMAVYEWESVEAARGFVARIEGPSSVQVTYTPFPEVWRKIAKGAGRLMLRRLSETSPAGPAPAAIFMEGFDPPGDASDQELGVLRDFYQTNLPLEAGPAIAYTRATSYEIDGLGSTRPLLADSPAFCSIYEADEHTAGLLVDTAVVSPNVTSLTEAPSAWNDRQIRWQIVYRRISECMTP